MTTKVTISACSEVSVRVCEKEDNEERWHYITGSETRDFYLWGGRTIIVKEIDPQRG